MKLDAYHPAISLVYFGTVLLCSLRFNQPVFLLLSFTCAFVYSVKLAGWRALVFNLALLVPALGYTAYYAAYHHFGITRLATNFIGNSVTLEAVCTGAVRAVQMASTLMWFSCMHQVVRADAVIYLLGRVWPRLSLFTAIALRTVPRVKHFARKVNTAQAGLGQGAAQGTGWQRLRHVVRMAAATFTWMLESFTQTADSMRSRGYTLKGRTAYALYRFDYRDRGMVLALFACISLILMGALLGQTRMLYNPEIIINRITPLSFLFYCAYGTFCLLPAAVQSYGEHCIHKSVA